MKRWIWIALIALVSLSACTGGSGVETPQATVTPLLIPEIPETGGEDAVATENALSTATLPSTAAPATDLPATVAPTEAPQAAAATATFPAACAPTQPDMLGPYFTPGAPTRAVVGEGYVLEGVVRTADGCAPVANAVIEVWQAGADGEYRDEYRATLTSDADGYYRFQGPFPAPYAGRPSHIHLRITAPGFRELVTQHYPQNSATSAVFDLILQPE